MIRIAAALALLSSCLVEVDYTGTRFSCAVDGICPDGFDCVDGVCTPSGTGTALETLTLTVSDAVTGSHADAPVLVALTADRIDYGKAAVDGTDILFTEPGGNQLAHEIERWDPLGTSHVWVKLPVLEAGASFVMTYGADRPDTQRPADVWSSYQLVYHLDGDGTEVRSGLDGAGQNGVGFAEGMFGGGGAFDGIDDHLLAGGGPLMRAASAASLTMWINPSVDPTVGALLEISDGAGVSTRLFINVNDSTPRLGVRPADGGGAAEVLIGPAVIAADRWSLLTATMDLPSQTAVVYVDGAEVGRTESLAVAPQTDDTDATAVTIGSDDNLNNFYSGGLDELRFAEVAHSADWIAAQYLSMTDALLSYQ